MPMKIAAMALCIVCFFSCSPMHRITKTDYDKNAMLYTANINGYNQKIYLRDDRTNLIRNEDDKNSFVSNYNNYWILNSKERTNEYYNYYIRTVSEFEFNGNDLTKNYQYSTLYFSGIKNMKSSNYSAALENFNSLSASYPGIVYRSDILFLKARSFEMMGSNDQALLNYKNFIGLSHRKYSSLFSEDNSDDTNSYIEELRYSYQILSNREASFPAEALSNEVPKYYNHVPSPGFNYYPQYRVVQVISGLGFDQNGFIFGTSFLTSINNFIAVMPVFELSTSYTLLKLNIPIQVFRSPDHRFGFEITPIIQYLYHYKTLLANDMSGNFYPIDHKYLNYGLETSIGFYILPPLYAGLSFGYMYYNQNNAYRVDDKINGTNYIFSYYNNSFYYLCLRYYFIKNFGIEAALKNSDFLAGINLGSIYIGYDINKSLFLINMYNMF